MNVVAKILTAYIPRQYHSMESALVREAVFTMKLEPELCDAFMAAAAARPASQIVRESMRDYVQQGRDYVEFLRRKVEKARTDIAASRCRSESRRHGRIHARPSIRSAAIGCRVR